MNHCQLEGDGQQLNRFEPESFAGWSFRTAVRQILGPELAIKYEEALRTGSRPMSENGLEHPVLGFADALARNHSDVEGAAIKWLEPRFSLEETCALVAFAGALRLYSSVFTVHRLK